MTERMQTKAVKAKLIGFFCAREGATAIEYGLIAGGIAVAVMPTVWFLGDTVLNELFVKVSDALISQ